MITKKFIGFSTIYTHRLGFLLGFANQLFSCNQFVSRSRRITIVQQLSVEIFGQLLNSLYFSCHSNALFCKHFNFFVASKKSSLKNCRQPFCSFNGYVHLLFLLIFNCLLFFAISKTHSNVVSIILVFGIFFIFC